MPPPLHLGVVVIEKGTFGSLSTKVANFTFTLLYLFWLYDIKSLHPWFRRKLMDKGSILEGY